MTWTREGRRGEDILRVYHADGWIGLCDYHQRTFFAHHPEAYANNEAWPTCRVCDKQEGRDGGAGEGR